jgi:hypothetical protein
MQFDYDPVQYESDIFRNTSLIVHGRVSAERYFREEEDVVAVEEVYQDRPSRLVVYRMKRVLKSIKSFRTGQTNSIGYLLE